jgi:hypothetical protein
MLSKIPRCGTPPSTRNAWSGVEQHLVRLQQIGPDDERPAVRQLGMGHLQLGPLRPPRSPSPRSSRTGRPHRAGTPAARMCRARWSAAHTLRSAFHERTKAATRAVGSVVAQTTRSACICLAVRFCLRDLPDSIRSHPSASRQTGPACSAVGNLELRLHRVIAQILADRVARQSSPPLNLADRHPLPKMPAPDHTQ